MIVCCVFYFFLLLFFIGWVVSRSSVPIHLCRVRTLLCAFHSIGCYLSHSVSLWQCAFMDWSGNESAKRPTVKTNNTKNISNTMNDGHKSYRNMRIMTPIVNVLLYDNASYNGFLCRILCGYQIKSKHKLSNTSACYITIILFTFTVFAQIRLVCDMHCTIPTIPSENPNQWKWCLYSHLFIIILAYSSQFVDECCVFRVACLDFVGLKCVSIAWDSISCD